MQDHDDLEMTALIDCLKKMLKLEGQPAIYIIIDAIDESPNHSGWDASGTSP